MIFSRKIDISKRKWLLLPIETKAREFDGKCLLAIEAVNRGWGVILGRNIRTKPYIPRGIFIENSISPGRAPDVLYSQSHGRKVVAWCEEGLVYLNAEEYFRRRVELRSFELIEKYFAWGKQQAHDMASESADIDSKKIIVSGNPRFDLLRPDYRGIFQKRIQQIRKKYGRTILINTRFARYNNHLGEDYFINLMKKRGKFKTPKHESDFKESIEFQKQSLYLFLEAVSELSKKFPDHTIIIRPHPSESHDIWKKHANKLKNVRIVFEGNVVPWILASEVCIHNNCTTGVEAYLLDKNPISYCPIENPEQETFLPTALSHQTKSIDELIDTINKILSDQHSFEMEHKTDLIRQYISGQDQPACQTILNALDEIVIESEPLNQTIPKSNIFKSLKRKILPFRMLLSPKDKHTRLRYQLQKFPGLSYNDVASFIKAYPKDIGDSSDIKITKIENNVFCLYK